MAKKLTTGDVLLLGAGGLAFVVWKDQQQLAQNPALQNLIAAGATNPALGVAAPQSPIGVFENTELVGAAMIDSFDLGMTHLAADVYSQQVGLDPTYADQVAQAEGGPGGDGVLGQAMDVTGTELATSPYSSTLGAGWNGLGLPSAPTMGISLGVILAAFLGLLWVVHEGEERVEAA